MTSIQEPPTPPKPIAGQGDGNLPATANWTAAFHVHDLLKAYDQAEAEAKDSGSGATSRLTDAQHLALDKAHADFWGPGRGRTPDEEYADRVLSTAIFYMGAAVKASPNPEQTLRALHAALGMTTTEG
ncbi:hypothetical protein [Streptomyces wuyuanensis]|uniref:hypothetical protein n=1 Tax=Streptomyces wuyuanensis TaxID=1196353 RepID=UPI00342641A5